MNAKLRVVSGAKGGIVSLRLPTVIGRSAEATIKVKSSKVSRSHCVLFAKGEAVWIRDLGSSNGTYINGKRLHDPYELMVGDLLKVGDVELEVIVELSPTGNPDSAGENDGTSLKLAPQMAVEAVTAEVPVATESAATRSRSPSAPAPQKSVDTTSDGATSNRAMSDSSTPSQASVPQRQQAESERVKIRLSESAILKYREMDEGSFVSIDDVAIDSGHTPQESVSPSEIPKFAVDDDTVSLDDPHNVRIDAGTGIKKTTLIEEDSQLGNFLKNFK